MRRASLQVKFGLSYILVIAAVLVFMNTYPLIVSENLVVRSKQMTLQSSVSVMVTALSGLEELSEENVASAMTLVEDTGISRILVTDAAGRILYDTRETDGAVGRYGLYTEIVQALRGYDAFYADFTDGAFRSRAASPVISLTGQLTGKLYGACRISDTIAAGETLLFSTDYLDSYVRKLSAAGVQTDLLSKIDLDGEPFFRLPLTEPCTLTIAAQAAISGAADVKVFYYYRSV